MRKRTAEQHCQAHASLPHVRHIACSLRLLSPWTMVPCVPLPPSPLHAPHAHRSKRGRAGPDVNVCMQTVGRQSAPKAWQQDLDVLGERETNPLPLDLEHRDVELGRERAVLFPAKRKKRSRKNKKDPCCEDETAKRKDAGRPVLQRSLCAPTRSSSEKGLVQKQFQ